MPEKRITDVSELDEVWDGVTVPPVPQPDPPYKEPTPDEIRSRMCAHMRDVVDLAWERGVSFGASEWCWMTCAICHKETYDVDKAFNA